MLKCWKLSTFRASATRQHRKPQNSGVHEENDDATRVVRHPATGLLCGGATSPQDRFEVILAEIKEIRVDMKQLRMEMKQLRMEMNQFRVEMNQFRKETVLRFEQVNERFEFIQTILGILIMGVLAGPFIAEWLRRRREERKQRMWDEVATPPDRDAFLGPQGSPSPRSTGRLPPVVNFTEIKTRRLR